MNINIIVAAMSQMSAQMSTLATSQMAKVSTQMLAQLDAKLEALFATQDSRK